MPGPTNISAATAAVIASLPVTLTVDLESQNVDLWYSFTAPLNQIALSVRVTADPDNGTYRPVIQFYEPDGTTQYLGIPWEGTYGHTNMAPIADATEVLICVRRVGSAALAGAVIVVDTPPQVSAPPASILIPADSRLPGELQFSVVFDAVTGDTLQVRPGLPAGETGDTLPSGRTLMTDYAAFGLRLMSPQLATLGTITGLFGASREGLPHLFVHASSTKFFTAQNVDSQSADATVIRIADDGTVETSWTLPSNSHALRAFAVSPDGNTAYYYRNGFSVLYRYDLAGDAPLSDFPLTNMTSRTISDYGVKVLADGTVVVVQKGTFIDFPTVVQWYADDGTELGQFFPAPYSVDRPERSSDDPASFWIWLKNSTDNSVPSARYRLTETSTGDALTTLDLDEYQETAKDADLFALNGPRSVRTGPLVNSFGAMTSCPLITIKETLAPPPPPTPPPVPPPVPIPPSDCCTTPTTGTVPNPTATGILTAPIFACEGGGLVEILADLPGLEGCWL